jgi:hypothetical protein
LGGVQFPQVLVVEFVFGNEITPFGTSIIFQTWSLGKIGYEILFKKLFSYISSGNIKPDSAPLSASLLADWLEVSGNMDAKEVMEDLQKELGLGSPMSLAE